MDLKLIAKPLAFALSAGSGGPLDGRVAFRSAREAAFGSPAGDLPQGFGAFAGVPISTNSDETTRWTRTGVSLPLS
jgi:hypothetical protein